MTTVDERTATAPRRRNTLRDLYHERTTFRFMDRPWRWALLSGIVIAVSLASFAINGLNLGIDFEGGTQWQFTVQGHSASIDDVRTRLDSLGLNDAKVLIVGQDSVRVQSEDLAAGKRQQVSAALADYAGIPRADVSITDVGPTWGDKVSQKALVALIVFFFVIALYLTFRFEWRMALAAILAVIHDIIVTVGVYSIFGFEVTPATVVAFLTILGFSLYDTVVVFDKVGENTARLGSVRGDTYSEMVNRSLNQVLMRSINTSFVALLPVASLLFVGSFVLGGIVLRDFALALFVGLLTGAYSSIFVATPILAWLKEREPRYRALRERSQIELARDRVAAPAAKVEVVAAEGEALTAGASSDDLTPATAPAAANAPVPRPPSAPARGAANPRPRQQRRRKRR